MQKKKKQCAQLGQLMELNNHFLWNNEVCCLLAARNRRVWPDGNITGKDYGLGVEGPKLTVLEQLLRRKVDVSHLYSFLIEVLLHSDHIACYKLFCGALVVSSEPNQIHQQNNHVHRKTK